MTREVKKPQSVHIRNSWRVRAYVAGKTATCIDWGMAPKFITAEEARRLACFLQDYAAWAKSLEPEFDERNE